MIDETILAALKKHACESPEKVAIIDGDQFISYQDLWQGVLRVADYFQKKDIKPGDRVLLQASSSVAFVYGYFASHFCKAIAVPIEANISKNRLEFIINKIKPVLQILNDELIHLEGVAVEGDSISFSKINIHPSDTADIIFSTGTTGEPKGVVLSHTNLWIAANHINQFIRNTDNDREIVTLPLSHSFGLGRLRCSILKGGALILSEGLAFVGKFFQQMEKHQATAFSAVPTGIALILKLSKDKLSNYADQIRYVEIGSSPMSKSHKKMLMDLLPRTRICMHYGLTEASRSAFIEFHEHSEKLNSLGKPAPGVDFQIQSSEDNGGYGVLWVRGGHVMRSYWKNEKLTEQVVKGDWINTGDVGFFDDDGFLYLKGRSSDMMNVGGRNVAPVEIESTLIQYEGLEEVVCVGVEDPDELMGDIVYAFIKLQSADQRLDKKNFVAFLRDRIESYKIPTHFIFVDEIPKTSSGKIQRHLLREKYAQFNTPLSSAA